MQRDGININRFYTLMEVGQDRIFFYFLFFFHNRIDTCVTSRGVLSS